MPPSYWKFPNLKIHPGNSSNVTILWWWKEKWPEFMSSWNRDLQGLGLPKLKFAFGFLVNLPKISGVFFVWGNKKDLLGRFVGENPPKNGGNKNVVSWKSPSLFWPGRLQSRAFERIKEQIMLWQLLGDCKIPLFFGNQKRPYQTCIYICMGWSWWCTVLEPPHITKKSIWYAKWAG